MRKCYLPILLLLLLLFYSSLSFAEDIVLDDENCSMCHKYPGLSRVSDEGYLRLFYINSHNFTQSLHTKVKCTGCHTDIKKIPHNDAKRVDCTTECHIKQPETGEKFSHKNIADILSKSIHNPDNPNVNKKIVEDFPKCTSCHNNPLYLSIAKDLQKLHGGRDAEQILKKCDACHEKRSFYSYFFNHVAYRARHLFPAQKSIETCMQCHAKNEMVEKHDLKNAASTYLDTFHGKAVKFNFDDAPTCIDCHVKDEDSVHSIMSHENPESAVYKGNRYKTCRDEGCHPSAGKNMGDIKMHVSIDKNMYPAEYYTALAFTGLTLGAFVPLMLFLLLELIREMFPNLKIKKDK